MKVCTKCGVNKPLEDFPWQKGNRRADCKSCALNAERKRNYNISHEDYVDLLTKQHGVCACCFKPESTKFRGKFRQLCVDHNHKTGKIRGLLCSKCNIALGLLFEDTTVIQSLLRYVEVHNA